MNVENIYLGGQVTFIRFHYLSKKRPSIIANSALDGYNKMMIGLKVFCPSYHTMDGRILEKKRGKSDGIFSDVCGNEG